MSAIRCPKNAAHSRFQGLSFKRAEFSVDLDAQGQLVREQVRGFHETLSDVGDHEIVCMECGAFVRRALGALPYIPEAGMVLKCDFSRGFVKPEMVKPRPVIVISERARNAGTSLVVPCSTVVPRDDGAPALLLTTAKYPFLKEDNWAKCEMVYAVSRARLANLDDPVSGALLDSRTTRLDPDDLLNIRNNVKRAAGIP